MTPSPRSYWLAWSQMPGVGPILLDRLFQHFGDLDRAWQADEKELLAVTGWGTGLVAKVLAHRPRIDLDRLEVNHCTANPHWWTPSDADYPRLLLEIPTKPPLLYYKGVVKVDENQGNLPTIAIVGTRRPTEYGQRWTHKISTLLAQRGFTIVSGMAEGIDAQAHQSCLEAGGRTIAVVGTGIDLVYPPHHRHLAAQIEQQGLILSEYPAGTTPARQNFPARNRIIAGLSRATIVMEAPLKSGALITAHQANDFGRDVYVLPGSIDSDRSIGSLSLLDRGAQPFLSAEHLLELLAAIPQLHAPQQLSLIPPTSDLAPQLQQIWQAIDLQPTSFDAIVAACHLPAPTVSSSLLELELLGLVTQLPGMFYRQKPT
jgi:DNA processing protein